MKTFFGAQAPARETQVRYKKCEQTSTVSEYVKEMNASMQLLSVTNLEPSNRDVIDRFHDGLYLAPKA